jgi:DNA invertase Pin-like site-specific DNA recombinase
MTLLSNRSASAIHVTITGPTGYGKSESLGFQNASTRLQQPMLRIDLTFVAMICNKGSLAMAEGKFVSYLRVSTDKQGRSGLGLEAQRDAVSRYLNGGRWKLVAEYVEVESGKRNSRPQLQAAISHAKATGAKLVIARLDRLARNLHFVSSLQERGVDFVAADMPDANRLTIHIIAAVAEAVGRTISENTKTALAAAKARGVKLGNPNGARALRGKQVGNADAVATIKSNAAQHAADLRGIVDDIRRSGITTVRGIAEELHTRGIRAPRGDTWHPTAVARLLNRLNDPTYTN